MEQLVAEEIQALVLDPSHEILQSAYEKSCTEVRSFFYNVVEQIHFSLLRGEVMDEILVEHMEKYFDTINTVDKVGEKQLSTNAFMNPFAAFIGRRTSEASVTEQVATKMEKQLKSRTLDKDAKRVRQNSVTPTSRTASAPSY